MNSYPPALRRTSFIGPAGNSGANTHVGKPSPARTVVRLWLPLTPLFLLLSPLALLLSPFLYVLPWRFGVSPVAAALALGRVLLSLSGADVDVDTPDALVRLKIL